MAKDQWIVKLVSLGMALCMAFQFAMPVFAEPGDTITPTTGTVTDPGYEAIKDTTTGLGDWEELSEILDSVKAEIKGYTFAEKESWPDGAHLGNGDIGVTVNADMFSQYYYVGKNDVFQRQFAGISFSGKEKAQEANTGNLANGKTVTVSSGSNAARVVDGDTSMSNSDGWASGYNSSKHNAGQYPDPQWFMVDLGSEYSLKYFKIYHDAACRADRPIGFNTKSYDLQVWKGSNVPTGGEAQDHADWNTVASVVGNTMDITRHLLDTAVTARYVRIYISEPVSHFDYSWNQWEPRARLQEFEIYSDYVEEPEEEIVDDGTWKYENFAAEKTVTASSGTNAAKAVDGDTTPGESSEGWVSDLNLDKHNAGKLPDEQWLMVDLGQVRDIGRFKIYHDGAVRTQHSPKFNTESFWLQVWNGAGTPTGNDASGWSTVATVKNNTKDITNHVLSGTVSAQYVRWYIVKPASNYDPSLKQFEPRARIQELEIYGGEPPEDVVATADPWYENLAYKKTVTVSSGSGQNGVVDGNTIWSETRNAWQSANQGEDGYTPQWLMVDLGAKYPVNHFKVYHQGWYKRNIDYNYEYPYHNTVDYQVQVWEDEGIPTGSDAVGWRTVKNIKGNTEDMNRIILDDPVEAQYVRLYITNPMSLHRGLAKEVPWILHTSGVYNPANAFNPRARIQQLEVYATDVDYQLDVDFTATQDMKNAEVTTRHNMNGKWFDARSFVTRDNLMITELTMDESETESMDVSVNVWTNTSGSVGTGDGYIYATRTRSGYISSQETVTATFATSILGVDPGDLTVGKETEVRKLGNLSNVYYLVNMSPGQTITIVSCVSNDGQAAAGEEAKAVTLDDIEPLRYANREWWKDYWLKSYVQLGDDVLNKYYYGSLYMLACSVREGVVTPGIFANFASTDSTRWGGAYFTNYNYQSPYWGVLSSNRVDLMRPYNETVINLLYTESYRRAAGGGFDGANFARNPTPPYNNTWSRDWSNFTRPTIASTKRIANVEGNQRSLGSFMAVNSVDYYRYTQDNVFLPRLYELVRANADFCLDFLIIQTKEEQERGAIPVSQMPRNYADWSTFDEWKDTEYRFIVLDSDARETSDLAYNATLDLGYFRYIMQAALEFSEILGIDEELRPYWQNVLDHISPFPTTTVDPETALYKESGTVVLAEEYSPPNGRMALRDRQDNVDNTNPIFQAQQINIGSDPELVEAGKNTVEIMHSWFQSNSFVKVFTAAVRVGYDPEEIIRQFKICMEKFMHDDLKVYDDCGHGLEKAGTIEAFNSMMLQGHEGILRLFPVWPKGMDAKFVDLRANGAFLVSSEFKDGEVLPTTIVSEAGQTLTVQSPWKNGVTVTDSEGNRVETAEQIEENTGFTTYTFNTQPGMTYMITKRDEIEPVDKSELDALIEQAETLNEDDYLAEEWEALQEALGNAKAVSDDVDATQDEVDDTAGALEAAIGALKELIPVTSIKINSVATTMVRKNKTLQLGVILTPLNANSGTEITWASSNEASVKVNAETGLVTGVKAGGSARVTATSSNGKTYTITVTVDS